MVQIDSLRLDEEATAIEAARFYRDFNRRVEHEANILGQLRADVVIGDIPPLAFSLPSVPACRRSRSGISPGTGFTASTPLSTGWRRMSCRRFARRMQRRRTRLRLPLHGGFEPMAEVTRDIPFVARRSKRERDEIRRALGLPGDRPVVLASFGAYGADIPVDELSRSRRFTLLAPRREPPTGLRYEDLVAASDVVISKPGYGIVSECVANGAALLYTSRGRFAEYDVFVERNAPHLAVPLYFAGRFACRAMGGRH